MKRRYLIPLIPAAGILLSMFFSHSCANTTQAPSGGAKDTIPPTLIGVSPLPGAIMVPVHKTEFVFTFNEYVTIKDQKAIFLSPPLEKAPKAKLRGKSVVVTFEDDLQPNTTYTLDISNAIADNNEGNMFPGYALTFSTGEQIDSMYFTGIVQDCSTLNPVKGATVMLYKDQTDSALFKHRPDVAAKTDDWGFFCLRNVQDTIFRVYAILDENGNNIFDPETESVAFVDTLVHPSSKMAMGIYELYKFDPKDTAACLKRHNDVELFLFKGEDSKQDIKNKGRVGDRRAFVRFMSPFPQVKSLSFKGVDKRKLITVWNDTRDSVIIWINDRRKQPDTLYLNVDYMKTDTTGKLVRKVETLKLGRDKKDAYKARKSSKRDLKHEDTIAVYKVESSGETFEQYGIQVRFEEPLILNGANDIKYEVTNARQQKSKGKFTVVPDSTDVRAFSLMHSSKILPGFEYKFTIPERKFRDINGYYNDSLVVTVKLPDDDKLSTLKLNMKGVEGRYIVDMMNEKRDKVERSYTISSDCTITFPYLKEGKKCIRITEDKNHNNRVDTGDLLGHRQPEKVRFYKLKNGTFLLDILPSSEMNQDVNVKEIFK